MYLQLFAINGIGLICRLSQVICPLNAFSLLFLLFDGRIHCRGPKALRVLKDVLKELFKALILRLMRTLTPAPIAFGRACLRLLRTGMLGSQDRKRRARRAKDVGVLVIASGKKEAQPVGSS